MFCLSSEGSFSKSLYYVVATRHPDFVSTFSEFFPSTVQIRHNGQNRPRSGARIPSSLCSSDTDIRFVSASGEVFSRNPLISCNDTAPMFCFKFSKEFSPHSIDRTQGPILFHLFRKNFSEKSSHIGNMARRPKKSKICANFFQKN